MEGRLIAGADRRTPLGHGARALLAVAVVAFVADAMLGAVTGLVGRIGGAGAPWWVAGHLPERGRWVIFALLMVATARSRLVDRVVDERISGPAAWRLVGVCAVAVPLLWIAAQWVVQAALISIGGQWDVDGLVFLAPDYYRRLFAGYAPWLLGGGAALVGSRHVA